MSGKRRHVAVGRSKAVTLAIGLQPELPPSTAICGLWATASQQIKAICLESCRQRRSTGHGSVSKMAARILPDA